MTTKLSGRERIQQVLAHKEPDRIGMWDAFWDDTILNWEQQGLPAGVSPTTYFDMDFTNLYIDASLRLPEKLLEDTDEFTIREDKHGFVAKQWKDVDLLGGDLRHPSTHWRLVVERIGQRERLDLAAAKTLEELRPYLRPMPPEEAIGRR